MKKKLTWCLLFLICGSAFLLIFSHQKSTKLYVSARLMGQMGNNLFQIATASALAWDHGAEAYFPDLSPQSQLFQHVLFRCQHEGDKNIKFAKWNEPSYSYTPIPFKPNISIDGYFQSEKYFAHHRDRLIQLFAPLPADLDYIYDKYQHILDHPMTVGVQLRYYKFEFPTDTLYPQYGRDYLEKAMSHFSDSALFVVSSNNLEFVKANIPDGKNVIFLENEPHYIDFILLSLCKHNIISNSSFGWWSAWLNQNPEKVVIRPEKWISGLPVEDVCPKSWISINAEHE